MAMNLNQVNWEGMAPHFPGLITRENLVNLTTIMRVCIGNPSLSQEEQTTVRELLNGFERVLSLWEEHRVTP
jgi:hypothetical protein